MSVTSSLNAAVMGLNANATKLAAISDNIANSDTLGYKRTQVEFSSLVIEQSTSAYAAGGVTVSSSKEIDTTGSLISTGSATDLAVAGRGLLPVTNASGVTSTAATRDLQLTPTGSFYVDAEGALRTESGLFLLGWPTDSEGDIGNVSRTSVADLEPVSISTSQLTTSPTDSVDINVNLPADATKAGAAASTFTLPVEYYDNLGRTQTLTFEFEPTIPTTGSSNTWTATILDSASTTPIGTVDLTFSDATGTGGSIDSVTPSTGITYDAAKGTLSMNLSHGPVEVAIGKINGTTGISQLAADFYPEASSNGTPTGNLQTVQMDERGLLRAVYDTGFTVPLYKIPVGDVPNPNGLLAADGQAYTVSAESGSLYLWDAGTGPVGTIEGYALMSSTTDVASEMTDLIETQRAYSSNAKIIQTVDEILQETTNLKR